MQQPDVNKTAELATRPCPVAALGLATGDDPARSLRWSELLATGGVGDELRAGLVADGTWWGCLALYRARDSAPFSGEDVSAVAGLVHPIAKAIRSTWTERSPAPSGVDEPPGSLVVTAEGRVVTATASADHWLGSLDATLRDSGTLVHALVARLGDTIGPYRPAEAAHTLVRGVDGAWLELHACPLGSSVGGGEIAITVQAAKPATVRELLLRAYGLTPRERQVADLVLAGRTTPDIATALFLSPHTVGDHLKAIFAKTGVHTRTELAHRLAGRSH
jgi:DNA-binding CsgD family transcriptional regulator